MKPLVALLALGFPLLAQTAPFAFGPALYTLRATDKAGGSLVFLDDAGRETFIDRDTQTSGGGGLLSTVPFHASFYGAFTATPDLGSVLYTKYGKVKAPFSFAIGGGSAGLGTGFGYKAAFGSHKLQGIYLWNRAKATAELLWDGKALEAQLKAWLKSPEGAPFKGVDIEDELNANRPTYLFPLDSGHFAFLTGSSILDLDTQAKTARFVFWDGGPNNVVGGPGAGRAWSSSGSGTFVGLSFAEKTAAFQAWQEPDGAIQALRPGMALTLTPAGKLESRPLPEGFRLSALPEGVRIAAGSKALSIAPADPKGAPIKVEAPSSLILPSTTSTHFFLYKHYATINDTLAKVQADGKVLWTADLGDDKFGILLAEQGDQVRVLVRASKTKTQMRLTLEASSGKTLATEVWGGEGAPAATSDAASLALAEDALLIPTRNGLLAWCPAKGEAAIPGESWATPAPTEIAALYRDARPSGTWLHIDGELRMKPLLARAQADQMVLLQKGRAIPLYNWINNGICLGSNAGDRNYFIAQGKPHPFFWRDFGSVVPPLAAQWAQEVLAPTSPAMAPAGSK